MIRVYIAKCGNTHSEQHDTAYRLLFEKTEELFGCAAGFEDIARTEKGKPYYKTIPAEFSISHCKGYAVCALCGKDEGAVGADCENVRQFRAAVMKRIFSEEEKLMIMNSNAPDLLCTKLWTLKESYVKYTGTGLAGHMQDLSFRFDGDNILSEPPFGFHSEMIDDRTVVTLCCNIGAEAEFRGDL